MKTKATKEVAALGACMVALDEIEGDAVAVNRILDYLRKRYPVAGKRQDGVGLKKGQW